MRYQNGGTLPRRSLAGCQPRSARPRDVIAPTISVARRRYRDAGTDRHDAEEEEEPHLRQEQPVERSGELDGERPSSQGSVYPVPTGS